MSPRAMLQFICGEGKINGLKGFALCSKLLFIVVQNLSSLEYLVCTQASEDRNLGHFSWQYKGFHLELYS